MLATNFNNYISIQYNQKDPFIPILQEALDLYKPHHLSFRAINADGHADASILIIKHSDYSYNIFYFNTLTLTTRMAEAENERQLCIVAAHYKKLINQDDLTLIPNEESGQDFLNLLQSFDFTSLGELQ